MLRWLLAAALLGGGCAYKPGSFTAPGTSFVGLRTTVGCLDVAVARRADPIAAAVIHYQFGNRCDRAVVIDLAAVAVVGRTMSGAEVVLEPHDPRGEISPRPLDGRLAGQEALAYSSKEPLAQVCVDLASLGRVTPAQWHCFATAAEIL